MIRHLDSAQSRIDHADQILQQLADSPDLESQALLYEAWIARAEALREQGLFEAAIASYDALIAHGEQNESSDSLVWIARALVGRGLAWRALGGHDDELVSYEQVRKRFGDSVDVDVRSQVAASELHHATTRGERGNTFAKVDTIRECQRIVQRYSEDESIATQDVLARVRLLRAELLGQLDYRQEQQDALRAIYDAYSQATVPALQARGVQACLEQANALVLTGLPHEAIALLEDVRATYANATELPVQEAHARGQHQLIYLLGETEQRAQQLRDCDDMLAQYGQSEAPAIVEAVINVIRLKAQAMQVLDDQADVLPLYEHVLRHYGDHADGFVRQEVAKTLHATASELQTHGFVQESLAVYDEVLKRYGEDVSTTMAPWVARAYLMKASQLSALDHHDEALVVLDEFFARFLEASAPVLALNVGRGLIMYADTLGALGKQHTQRSAYAEIVARYSAATHPDLRDLAAKARFRLQSSLAEDPDALPRRSAIVDDLMQHHAQDTRTSSRVYAATALYDLTVTLRERNDLKPALAAYDRFLAAFQADTDIEIEARVARVYLEKGLVLMELLARPADALPLFDALLARFSHRPDPALREVLSKAAVSRQACLNQLNRLKQSGVNVAADDGNPMPVTERDALEATINEAHTLGGSGQHQQAITALEELLVQHGASVQPELRRLMARARVERGFQLTQLGLSSQAIGAFDEVIVLYENDPSMHFQALVALALYNKAIQYSKLERPADEVAVYDTLIARFHDVKTGELRERVAKSLFGRALTLERIDTPLAAIAAYDATVEHAAQADEAITRLQAARALISKAALYGKLGRHNDEALTCQDLIARFTGAEDPEMRARLISAYERMASSYEKLGQRAKQVSTYENLLAQYGALMDANARHGIENHIIKAEPSVTRRLRLVLTRSLRGSR